MVSDRCQPAIRAGRFRPSRQDAQRRSADEAPEYAVAAWVAARKLQTVVLESVMAEERAVAAQLRVEALRLELAIERGVEIPIFAKLAAQRSSLHHRAYRQQEMRSHIQARVREAEAAASLELLRPPALVVPADTES